eukprot:Colp12_sorted_trinity150504_noHs@20041
MKTVAFLFTICLVGIASAATFQVTVGQNGGLTFTPDTLTISTGDTVNWNFLGGTSHDVVSSVDNTVSGRCSQPASPFLQSVVFSSSGTYSMTFNTPGTYVYHCSVGTHCANGMFASVTVTSGSSSSTTTASSTTSSTGPSASQSSSSPTSSPSSSSASNTLGGTQSATTTSSATGAVVSASLLILATIALFLVV